MLDLNDYFDPVSIEKPDFESLTGNAAFPHNITIHTDSNPIKDLAGYKVALLGVPDGRNSPDNGSMKGPDAIREQLFSLAKIPGKTKIIDLGNMKQGVTFNDTIAGLTDILCNLLGENVFPVVMGGSSALISAIDHALTRLKIIYSLLAVDPRIDYSNDQDKSVSFSYLNKILQNHKSTFSQYINIGYQTYLNDQQVLNRFLRRHFELIRIGDVRQAICLTEPLFRDSQVAVSTSRLYGNQMRPALIFLRPTGFMVRRYASWPAMPEFRTTLKSSDSLK